MRLRLIDAFTDRPFAGNPAAVCVLDGPGGSDGSDWPDASWMQHVGTEMNQAMTAFVRRRPGGSAAEWEIRWFSPVQEMGLCGHATLASAFALHTDGLADLPLRFESRSGPLGAEVAADGTVTLDFPANAPQPIAVPEGLAVALGGATVVAAYDVSALGDLVIEVPDEQAVVAVTPDLSALASFCKRGVCVTAAADPGSDGDFVSRFFAPAAGIPEDPVTGSAHTALAPLWSARLGRTDLVGRQASARGGRVTTRLRGGRVLLGGRAVTVLDGTLLA